MSSFSAIPRTVFSLPLYVLYTLHNVTHCTHSAAHGSVIIPSGAECVSSHHKTTCRRKLIMIRTPPLLSKYLQKYVTKKQTKLHFCLHKVIVTLCDYKLNQIFWTSEPGPIMDDMTFCRNMLNCSTWFVFVITDYGEKWWCPCRPVNQFDWGTK